MRLLEEFKTFAMRGNVLDLAVGVVVGTAFNKIVSSFVSDIVMPLLGILTGGVSFVERNIILRKAELSEAGDILNQAITLNYGMFMQSVFDFFIIAFTIFMLIKLINRFHEKENIEKETKAPSRDIVLLEEIRDLLKK